MQLIFMHQIITTTIICAILMVFGIIAAPSLELFSLIISIISLSILFFALKGKRRFQVALILTAISLVIFVIAYFAAIESQKLANDINLYQRNLLESGAEFAKDFKYNNYYNSKYFEKISNFSFANAILIGVFSLFISKADKQGGI
jgi:hypothetical protein